VSELFEFKLVKSETVKYPKLRSERFQLPRKAGVSGMSLSLYEMIPNRNHETDLPYVRQFDEGNMGLKGFSKERTRSWEVQGIRVGPGVPAVIRLDRRAGSDGNWNLLLFFLNTSNTTPPAPGLVINDVAEDSSNRSWECLVGDWWILRASGPARDSIRTLGIEASCNLLLTDVTLDSAPDRVAFKPSGMAGDVKTVETAPFAGRWSKASCGFLAPVPSAGGAYLLVFAQAPNESVVPVSLSVSLENETVMSAALPAGVIRHGLVRCTRRAAMEFRGSRLSG
jgi:hypothetical protein